MAKHPFNMPPKKQVEHSLPVLLPFKYGDLGGGQIAKRPLYLPKLQPKTILWMIPLLCLPMLAADVMAAPGQAGLFSTIMDWTPFLLIGFGFNLLISFMSMAIGSVAGSLLGILQISRNKTVRKLAWFFTQFFRNSPWLVLLFFCMFMIPFEVRITEGFVIPFPDWAKAVVGLSLPVMANVSEIVRGAVASIPSGQWEAAESLAFSRRQQIWMIIMPQCYKRMLPPWMNLYSILTMATVLASIVGVEEVMTLTGQVLAADGRPELLVPLYSFILVWFFVYTFPIARLTVRLERKYSVKI